MHIQDQRLANKRTVNKNLCKECLGPLIEKYLNGQEIVVCAANPTHVEFITEAKAANLRKLQQLQTHEVLQNYPQFNPDPVRETCQESIDSLFP